MSVYDTAQREIYDALVCEYVKKNPGIKKSEVILSCENGELIFKTASEVVAELKTRKKFSRCLNNNSTELKSLAVHRDKYWQDCCESVIHSKLMLDILRSDQFKYIDVTDCRKENNFLKNKESACARATVRIEELKKALIQMKKERVSATTPRGRVIISDYLNAVIDQLSSLHKVYKKEVELGNDFEVCVSRFIKTFFKKVEKTSASFNLKEIKSLYKGIVGKKGAVIIDDKNISLKLNHAMLQETKNTLTKAVDDMKINLEGRRGQIQEIWANIVALKEVVKNTEELNRLDRAGKMPPEDAVEVKTDDSNRMVRFLKDKLGI